MMLNPEMKAVGIGLVENPSTGYEEFWVTDFGSVADTTARPVSDAEGDAVPTGDAGDGDTGAVFPLPEEYRQAGEDFTDDWGAARGHGTHEGTDVFAPDGTPIYSVTDGTVVPVSGADGQGWNTLGGWTVMVEATQDVGPVRRGDTLYYAHMLEPTPLRPGDTVEAGDQIGKVGSTGEGPPGTLLPEGRGEHLHLGWYDPTMQRAEAASGAMNPYPLLSWLAENGGAVTGEEAAPAAPGACPERTGGGSGGASTLNGGEQTAPGSGDASDLLDHPNFEASPGSEGDLRSGIVDERLVAALQAITEEHAIYVSAIRTDHPFGPTIPEGYIGASGVPNSHYYGRAADIAEVDGRPVEGNGTSEAVLDVGRILAGIPPGERPDEIVGPPEWQAELGYPREAGFITDPGLNAAHSNHVHVALQSGSGTVNTR
jgi:collagen type III alpha